MARSSVRGAASLRRLLRRLPDAARMELGTELQAIGDRLLGRAKAETPVRTGALRAALGVRVAVKTLQLRLGLITKADKRRFFYGYILDQGRRAQMVKAKRRIAGMQQVGLATIGRYSEYMMRVGEIPSSKYEFVFGRRQDFKQNELPYMRKALDRVLEQAARGSGND